MFRKYLFKILIVLCGVVYGIAGAHAQDCTVDYELIFRMSKPVIGSYNVWDVLYGEQETEERLTSGVYDANGWLIAAGQRAKAGSADVDLILVALGRRGRMHWEQAHSVKGLHEVKKMIARGDGFLVLGNLKDAKGKQAVWLGFVDANGKLTGSKTLSDKKDGMVGTDIIPAHDGKNYMLATQFITAQGEPASHAAVHKITPDGKVLFGPAFLPGAENKILGLTAVADNHYIAVGYIMRANGQKAGWMMRLNEQAGIDWQRQYARGSGAELVAVRPLLSRYAVVVGGVDPTQGSGENAAGWLMTVGIDSGEIGWQRYYTGDINYAGRDLLTNPDGMISVLLEGTPAKEDDPDYVRLLTINPRGQLFISDEYFNGEAADAYQIIKSPSDERVLLGRTGQPIYREQRL